MLTQLTSKQSIIKTINSFSVIIAMLLWSPIEFIYILITGEITRVACFLIEEYDRVVHPYSDRFNETIIPLCLSLVGYTIVLIVLFIKNNSLMIPALFGWLTLAILLGKKILKMYFNY